MAFKVLTEDFPFSFQGEVDPILEPQRDVKRGYPPRCLNKGFVLCREETYHLRLASRVFQRGTSPLTAYYLKAGFAIGSGFYKIWYQGIAVPTFSSKAALSIMKPSFRISINLEIQRVLQTWKISRSWPGGNQDSPWKYWVGLESPNPISKPY